MNLHPALSMLSVWTLCITAYLALPYQLLERQLTWKGGFVFAIFMAAFLVGTLLVPRRPTKLPADFRMMRIDARFTSFCLMAVSVLATVFLLLDANQKALFDLAEAYQLRSDTAEALLKGESSSSSTWFKMAFMFYPAGYVFIAVHTLYAKRVLAWKIAVFGLLPIVLASIVMGGRSPILYVALVLWLSIRERRKIGHEFQASTLKVRTQKKWWPWVLWAVVLIALLVYFASIFVVRANLSGGAAAMFEIAEERWGIGFRGPMSSVIWAILGEEMAYLLFIFVWYVVQGFVMSNYLFSAYDGPLQLGVYGLDLVTALMRTLAPEQVATGFDALLTLGTYGFFPSAWGSLYVDFSFSAILICAVWGLCAAFAYRRIVIQKRTDWLMLGPFATVGIIFSFINTPFGFTNGLVTHCWLLLAFLLLRRSTGDSCMSKVANGR